MVNLLFSVTFTHGELWYWLSGLLISCAIGPYDAPVWTFFLF